MSVFDNINYDNCITNLTSSLQKHFGIKVNYKTNPIIDDLLKEKDYQNIIVFVFDAMGESIIEKNTTSNHFLQTHKVSSMYSTFPPTTANATTSYMSGLNPITTGWLGWSTYHKDLNMVVEYDISLTLYSSARSINGSSGWASYSSLTFCAIFRSCASDFPLISDSTSPIATENTSWVSIFTIPFWRI